MKKMLMVAVLMAAGCDGTQSHCGPGWKEVAHTYEGVGGSICEPAGDGGTIDARTSSTCDPAKMCVGVGQVNACNNMQNCGQCGNSCDTDNSFCNNGKCDCPVGMTFCSGGSKGKGVCVTGSCPTATDGGTNAACDEGKTNCAGTCVDTQVDSNNCNGCGLKCASGQGCLRGVCTTPTSDGPCWPFTVTIPSSTVITSLSFWDKVGNRINQPTAVTTSGGSFSSPTGACAANVDWPNRSSWTGLPAGTCALTFPNKGTVNFYELSVGTLNWGCAHDNGSHK